MNAAAYAIDEGPDAAARLDRIVADASARGLQVLRVDCRGADTRDAVLAAFAAQVPLPAWFGHNLDALYDCLTDLRPAPPARACLLLVRGLPDDPPLVDVLLDAADFLVGHGQPFELAYSRRSPPALPAKSPRKA